MIKTGYSFSYAAGNIPDVMDRLVEIDYPAAPIADVNSTFGWVKWRKDAARVGLKPVFGVSLYVTNSINSKKPVIDLWTFLAKDDVSCVNRLVALATKQGRSYPRIGFLPLLKYTQLADMDGVIKISGHKAQLNDFEPMNDLYIGLSPSCYPGYIKKAIDKGFSFVQAMDNRYPNGCDQQFWEMVAGHNADRKTYPQHILSDEEWGFNIQTLIPVDSAKANLKGILDSCNAALPQGELLEPDRSTSLSDMCYHGAANMGLDLSNGVYRDRLEMELKVISDKGFEDYFFILEDLMRYARRTMLCGPARGSSAGSLVCYLLGITTVDPIKYGLLFFRFLDPNRVDLPDVDADFPDDKRHMIFEYLAEKYGTDKVAKLGTVALYKERSALDDAGKALGIPKFEFGPVLNAVEQFSAGDERAETALAKALSGTAAGKALVAKYPAITLAGRMGGHPRHSSVHAAGAILTKRPIVDYVAFDSVSGAVHCDKKDAECLDLLKIDVLGLKQLSIYEETIAMAGLDKDCLSNVPLDDEKSFKLLNDGHTSGIFQFDGGALKALAKEITITSLEDISALSALARPGPLASGAAHDWARRHSGGKVSYPHPCLEPYLSDTKGVLVYQETVMLIARDLCGMSWKDVAALRKAIAKSKGAEAMKPFAEPFVDGLMEHGMERVDAEKFWREVLGFGSYSFNRSHSISYGLVSYYGCWLKANHPLEFAAASLQRKDSEAQLTFLRELDEEGISYTPVDGELSGAKWQVAKGRLFGPITLIKGIGPKMLQNIMSARARGEPLSDRAAKLLANPVTDIDELYPVKKIIEAVGLERNNILSKPAKISDIETNGTWQDDVLIVGVVDVCKVRDENEASRIEDRIGRGQPGRMTGLTKFLELRVRDDSGTYYCKIGRNDFAHLAPKIQLVFEAGLTIVACKGTITPQAPVLLVKQLRILT